MIESVTEQLTLRDSLDTSLLTPKLLKKFQLGYRQTGTPDTGGIGKMTFDDRANLILVAYLEFEKGRGTTHPL